MEIKQLALEISKNDLKFRLNEEYLKAMIDIHRFIRDEENAENVKKKIFEEIICNSFNDIDNAVDFTEVINIFNKTLQDISNRINSLYATAVKYMNNNMPSANTDMEDIMFFNPRTDIISSNMNFNF